MIDISKLNKGEVLAALYNNSMPLGMGILHFTPEDMTKEQGEELLKSQTYFNYLQGRVMKVDLSKDEFSPHLYDRNNGEGAAQRAIDTINEN